jgi:hypothetical protein
LVRFTRIQQEREKVKAEVKLSKQSRLDDVYCQLNVVRNEPVEPIKEIIISALDAVNNENEELALRTEFRLVPSKASFNKISLDLFFEDHLLKSSKLAIPQSMLLGDILEYPLTLDMKGIGEGNYLVRAEMYEPWSSGEKLNFTAKEITVHYVPQTRAERLVRIPAVKSVAGTNLTVVSSTARDIYREIEQDQKKEAISTRERW